MRQQEDSPKMSASQPPPRPPLYTPRRRNQKRHCWRGMVSLWNAGGPSIPFPRIRVPPFSICHLHTTGKMNQPEIVNQILTDPPQEFKDIMNDPAQSQETRDAIAAVAPAGSSLKSISTPSANGATGASSSSAAQLPNTNKPGDGRLQVVDENQVFSYVSSCFNSFVETDTQQ